MKVLIINGHPAPEESTANAAIVEAFKSQAPEAVELTIRELARTKSERGFNVEAEQAALRAADVVVLEFPLYWYSVPGLLKTWMDDVLTYGFTYGSTGTALHGKKLVLSFTVGGKAEDYVEGGPMNWPVEGFLPPLIQTGRYCGFKEVEAVYSAGMLYIEGVSGEAAREAVLEKARGHAERLAVAVLR